MRARSTSRTLLAAGAAVAALAASPPASASAAETRALCADRATLKSTPGGIVVAHLRRPQTVTLLARTPDGAWAQVKTRKGLRGWILAQALCRR